MENNWFENQSIANILTINCKNICVRKYSYIYLYQQNETIKTNIMKSEVEINKQNILVGDKLIYVDNCNCEAFIVTQINMKSNELTVIDETGIEDQYFFSDLQIGWQISEKTKENNSLLYRMKYN